MPSIMNINGRFRAQVRVAGLDPKTKTFATREEAQAWAEQYEKECIAKKACDDVYLLPRFKPKHQAGIYFLFKGNECVYVGQSRKPHARVHDHIGVIDYDEFAILPCAADALNRTELHYIKKLMPKSNKKGAVEYVDPRVRRAERRQWWKERGEHNLLREANIQ